MAGTAAGPLATHANPLPTLGPLVQDRQRSRGSLVATSVDLNGLSWERQTLIFKSSTLEFPAMSENPCYVTCCHSPSWTLSSSISATTSIAQGRVKDVFVCFFFPENCQVQPPFFPLAAVTPKVQKKELFPYCEF